MHLEMSYLVSFSAEMVFKSRHMAVNKKSTRRDQQRTNTASENRKLTARSRNPRKAKRTGQRTGASFGSSQIRTSTVLEDGRQYGRHTNDPQDRLQARARG